MTIIENLIIGKDVFIKKELLEAVNKNFFKKEGSGLFAYTLQEYLGKGDIMMVVQPLSYINEYGNYFNIHYVVLELYNKFYDVDGEKTMDDISKIIKLRPDQWMFRQASRKEFTTKFMGTTDDKPIFGSDSPFTKKQVIAFIENTPLYKDMHDKRLGLK